MLEQSSGSSYTQIVYGPAGGKLALMSGQTLNKSYIRLPGGTSAVYMSGTTGPVYYSHADWLGSTRLATTQGRTVYFDVAYGPYGETYVPNGSGTLDVTFTGQHQNTGNNLYDFMFREYNATHGRWPLPDPAGIGGVDPASPQTWNRYAYVSNRPLNTVDPFGLWQSDTAPYLLEMARNAGFFARFEFFVIWPSPFGHDREQTEYFLGFVGRSNFPSLGGAKNDKCPAVPDHPPGVDINSNIKQAQLGQVLTDVNPGLSAFTFYELVKNKGPMDYKQPEYGSTMNDLFNKLGPSPYQEFGNFNYGAVAAAWGVPENIALRAAGWAQTRAGTSKPEWDTPLGSAPYGDDPDDQEQIRAGYTYYANRCYKAN